jgi:hypothetical protein
MYKLKKYKIETYIVAFLGILLMAFAGCEETADANINPDNETENKGNLPDVTNYPIVGTGQVTSYNNFSEIDHPNVGEDFYGQNSNYPGNLPQYVNNGDGTITDMVTGLMWSQSPDINGDGDIDADDKLTYDQALSSVTSYNQAGYADWRIPSIKELYSLMMFYGLDPSGVNDDTEVLVPFVNTGYFHFGYGDESAGERQIDAQFVTTSVYTGTTMGGNTTMFGLNLADGRIKGYPIQTSGRVEKTYYVYYVRGNENYGINQFINNNNGTITDKPTGLMWMTTDSEQGMNWKDALSFAENLDYAGYSDWRLPDAKELQSIIDYSRSPDGTGTAAIDPMFTCTAIVNEAGVSDFPCYWSSTTHANMRENAGANAAYVSFGRALGYWMGMWQDVHGAGAQRSDPKLGDAANYPYGHGPQGDAIRILNFVRCVRSIE